MSKAAVSYHFPTNNDLLHALADPLLDGLDALVERHPRAPTWPDGVQALLDDYLTHANRTSPGSRMARQRQGRSEPSRNRRTAAPKQRPHAQAITGSTTDDTAGAARDGSPSGHYGARSAP
jgi:AcrR family transcriptional regulator